jgi:putative transposase
VKLEGQVWRHEVSEAKRLRMLEDENRKLKNLLAESMLDNAALKELVAKKMVRPAAKREAVAHLRSVLEMSERRTCSLIAADRKMLRYRSQRPPDTELRARLHELAAPPFWLSSSAHPVAETLHRMDEPA